jgi:hypothetical protein
MANNGGVSHIAAEIVRYLADHPDAADSADGIQRWWLARQRIDDAVTEVEQALNFLEQRGEVVKTVLPDGRFLYRRSGRRSVAGGTR